jgi:uncharacterized protein YgbK (DUF1537 family)
MIKLLVIADDFTGALDTGVQFTARGAAARVETDPLYDFSKTDHDTQVLVLDAETRHLPPEQAYKIVFRAVRAAQEAHIPYIYKKTDSVLRGNIGSELAAVLDATRAASLPFIPAFPQMKRITAAGIHYVEGVPVAESAFGQDPFDPVRFSSVPEILRQETDKPVTVLSQPVRPTADGICVYDADNDVRLWQIGETLGLENLSISAGCAGFASVLAELLELKGETPAFPTLAPALFVICGSINPVTRTQIKTAVAQGFAHIRLSLPQKMNTMWLNSESCRASVRGWLELARENPCCILDSNDPDGSEETQEFAKIGRLPPEEVRTRISTALGRLSGDLLSGGLNATLMCTGGDTLLALMRTVGVSGLTPIGEVAPGAVLSRFTALGKTWNIISKSGGFGEPDLLCRLAELVGAAVSEGGTSC